jgi:hypothetical protein
LGARHGYPGVFFDDVPLDGVDVHDRKDAGAAELLGLDFFIVFEQPANLGIAVEIGLRKAR